MSLLLQMRYLRCDMESDARPNERAEKKMSEEIMGGMEPHDEGLFEASGMQLISNLDEALELMVQQT